LESTVNELRKSHKDRIDADIPPGTYHQLATAALQASCSWIESLENFITDTYLEYAHASFGKEKAWHVATRLALKLISV